MRAASTAFLPVPQRFSYEVCGPFDPRNWTVAVYDQVDLVGKQRKDRTLARIYSPGTTEGADVYLGAVWFSETASSFAAAVVDLTTGTFTTYEGSAAGSPDSWITDDLAHFFQVHPPKELVVWWQGAPIAMPSEMAGKEMTGATVSCIDVWRPLLNPPFNAKICFARPLD